MFREELEKSVNLIITHKVLWTMIFRCWNIWSKHSKQFWIYGNYCHHHFFSFLSFLNPVTNLILVRLFEFFDCKIFIFFQWQVLWIVLNFSANANFTLNFLLKFWVLKSLSEQITNCYKQIIVDFRGILCLQLKMFQKFFVFFYVFC